MMLISSVSPALFGKPLPSQPDRRPRDVEIADKHADARRTAGRGLISGHALVAVLWPFVLLALISTVLLLSAGRWLSAIGHSLAYPESIAAADAIVVLAGGGPERLGRGVDLYNQGMAPELWYTGNMPVAEMKSFLEGELGRQFAIDHGVPENSIRLLPTASTWEDGRGVAALARQEHVRRILIVTSWYHGRRAACVMRQQLAAIDMELSFASAPTSAYGADDWWRSEDGLVAVVNELIKLGFYWWQYNLLPWQC